LKPVIREANLWAIRFPEVADRRRAAGDTARSKPASQGMILNVSKAASNSTTGASGLGHKESIANDC
jgi:hypothetical protein